MGTRKSKKIKKILIATPLYPPDIGGPATYTKLLEEKLPLSKILVEVVSFSESRKFPKGLSHFHFFIRVIQKLLSADLILAQDPVSVGLPALVAAKLLRRPLVIRMPGDYAWEQSVQRFGVTDTIDVFQHTTYSKRVELLRWIQRFVARHADTIITPSNYFKRIVTTWGIPDSKIVTIYNGVAIPEVEPKQFSNHTMVTAGRLVQWKGIDMLIESLATLVDWDLVVIGDGPERARLEKLARDKKVSDRVMFTGSLPRQEMLGYCAGSDVFVLNTHFESFSFQLVEVMLLGCRIITTNIGSIPELITQGVEGVLIDPDDQDAFVSAITSVPRDDLLWEARRQSAKTKAPEFSIDASVTGVVSMIKESET